MFLNKDTFLTVIESTPLVSIDLIIENEHNEILLGNRINEPAKGFWFVPGGRVRKNESLRSAFERLTVDELGQTIEINDAKFFGAYDHFYSENIFDNKCSTHYVALGYRIFKTQNFFNSLPINKQHQNYKWVSVEQLIEDKNTHTYTKNYFR
ncbi:GDP-mannose mannosyl hydrolase [Paraglaciecola marina]|uniref:GDP-mannose mannosyl hydrolase n=1 Tax=Paraglaciecola marina TaxID=2500157 RepID=UPI00105BDDF9|nr:GDP-mannose mannosyl hydrolase [Paraglaciecola marina]